MQKVYFGSDLIDFEPDLRLLVQIVSKEVQRKNSLFDSLVDIGDWNVLTYFTNVKKKKRRLLRPQR